MLHEAYYGTDTEAKQQLVQEVRDACKQFGFFQLVNHAIPTDLQQQVLEQSKDFFELPLETKQKYDKGDFSALLIKYFQLTKTVTQRSKVSSEATSVFVRRTSRKGPRATSKKDITWGRIYHSTTRSWFKEDMARPRTNIRQKSAIQKHSKLLWKNITLL